MNGNKMTTPIPLIAGVDTLHLAKYLLHTVEGYLISNNISKYEFEEALKDVEKVNYPGNRKGVTAYAGACIAERILHLEEALEKIDNPPHSCALPTETP